MNRIVFVGLLALSVLAVSPAGAQISIVDVDVSSELGLGGNPTFSKWNVVDGNPDTFWMSDGYGYVDGGDWIDRHDDNAPYIAFYFDGLYAIDRIDITNCQAEDGGRGIRSLNILISLTGNDDDWVSLSDDPHTLVKGINEMWTEQKGTWWEAWGPQTIEFEIPVEARAVKFDILSTQYNYIFGVSPIEGWVNASLAALTDVTFSGTPVPEPVTMSLLALGGLALLRRHSR